MADDVATKGDLVTDVPLAPATPEDAGADKSIRAISRSLAILQTVNRVGAVHLNAIAEATGLPYQTAYRIVQALVQEGMLVREPKGRLYRVTALVKSLSNGFEDESRLEAVSAQAIAGLTKTILWPVIVASRVGDVMIVRSSTTDKTSLSYRNYRPGHTMPLLHSTSGLVHLAFSAEEDRRTVLEGLALSQSPSAGYGASQALADSLSQIRQNGFAAQKFNFGAPAAGRIASISVPLFGAEGGPAALTMIFFATAMSTDEAVRRYVGPIRATAEQISAQLNSGGPPPP
ncbi:MAG: IclR family transcriptional regulator domain-containing protein [Caulobacteraceae bacterium]